MRDFRDLLEEVQNGSLSIEQALDQLKQLNTEDLGFAKIDHHRTIRQGFPEVVYCEGKTVEQSALILERLALRSPLVLGTRASFELYEKVQALVPDIEYHPLSKLLTLERVPLLQRGNVLVVCAGTSDLPVAEEALLTCRLMGNRTELLCDVGVAGIHRLFEHMETLYAANVIIVVAGMEGALVSVVAGLVDKPVIAVPTSIGYGANLGGITTLLSMLSSCASGVTVVNINNGFGAGYAASLMNTLSVPANERGM